MDGAERLTTRQELILRAVIAGYLETGEPVGSGTIARAAGSVSSATIRNEMAALTSAGLLEQPHTSAGRVPSPSAFRRYVDGLTRAGAVEGMQLAGESRRVIDEQLQAAEGTERLFERSSALLAELTNGVGVAVASAAEGDLLEHVHFSRLGDGRVLAVVVTRAGVVRDRLLQLDRDMPVAELESAAAVLNERFRGWTVEGIRAELLRLIERERSEYQRLLGRVERLWSRTMPAVPQFTVYVGGVGNLLDGAGSGPAAEDERARLRALMGALETKQQLMRLLEAYVDARQRSVRVVFGMEEQQPEMAGLVLIASPATAAAGERRGTIGVIGRTRIDYETTIQTVRYVAHSLNRML